MVTTSRFDRPRRADHDIFHLTLLAESDAGYRNLIKVSSNAYLDGFYYKPRVDFDLLEQHREGLIATSGCLGGAVSQRLLADDYDGARELAAKFQSVLGRDSFFIELQDHGLPDQHRVNPNLLRIARDLQAPLLATNDSHYTHREDAEAHDALLCVQTGAKQTDVDRFKFDAEEFYLKTAAEMRHLFVDYEEACDNTLWIAERADVEIEFGNAVLPSFQTPEGHDEDSYLRELTLEGAQRPLRRGDPRQCDGAHRVRARRHQDDGLLRVLPRRLGPRPVRAPARDPRRPGTGERGRILRRVLPPHRRRRPHPLRPAVRALPEPGSQADARHRHGLRLPLPRRDDQVRGRALRLGPRRPDRHVLHDQSTGRGARRGARPRLPVRRSATRSPSSCRR